MSASPGTFALTMESVARLLGYLACSSCGLHGPHRTFVEVDGGSAALCQTCQSQPVQDARQDASDALHIAAPAGGGQ